MVMLVSVLGSDDDGMVENGYEHGYMDREGHE